jgi:outer membrane protein OmpA-like peptidoglycan-associated protein
VESAPSASAPSDDASQSLQHRPPRIDLRFEAAHFSDLPSAPVALELPEDFEAPPRLLRISVELTVAGAVEAAADFNDVLDVPLLPRFVRIRLVDELGGAIAGEKLELAFDNEQVTLTGDGKGQIRVDNPPVLVARLKLLEPDSLEKKLKALWDKPRPGARLRVGPGVEVVSFRDAISELVVGEGTTIVSVQPRVVKARLFGSFFETSKTFLLRSALDAMRGMKALYDANPNSQLLLVGHADRSGSVAYNDTLSLDRADAVAAFLKDDVEGWFKWYGAGVANEKRWGKREDRLMLAELADATVLLSSPDPILAFQESRELAERGEAGPETRRALIGEYMAVDDTKLPADVTLVTHGAGEHFPEIPTADGVEEDQNRRVEMFFFDGTLGVQPPVPGKNSKAGSAEYPEWRERSIETHDFDASAGDTRPVVLHLLDAEGASIEGANWTINHAFGADTGITGSDGLVLGKVPTNVTKAILTHDTAAIELELVPLTPSDDVLGAQHRLNNLGYRCGVPPSGTLDAATGEALRRFQTDEELGVTGTLSLETSARLREIYGH